MNTNYKSIFFNEEILELTNEDHILYAHGSTPKTINYNEERFIEFNGYMLRFTRGNKLYKSLRVGDKILVRYFYDDEALVRKEEIKL